MPWTQVQKSGNYGVVDLNLRRDGVCHGMASTWAVAVIRGESPLKAVPHYDMNLQGNVDFHLGQAQVVPKAVGFGVGDEVDVPDGHATIVTFGMAIMTHTVAWARRLGKLYLYDPNTGVWQGNGTLAELGQHSSELPSFIKGANVPGLGVTEAKRIWSRRRRHSIA